MKILHVFHHYRPYRGGVEKVIEGLNRNLKKKGHECTVLCLNRNPGKKERLKAIEEFDEASVERIGFANLHYYKLAPFSLKRLKEFDVVHVHGLGFFADYLALTRLLHNKPLILSTHGGIFHTKDISFIKKAYFNLIGRLALKQFAKVVAVSSNDLKLFRKIVPEKKLVLIENAIDFEKLQKTKSNPETNNFLFVGRLSKNKGLKELLKAFAVVKKEKPDFMLRIVGREFDLTKKELQKEINELGLEKNVMLLGEVTDKELDEAYGISGIFVSASSYEGFGISTVEAMAAGLIPILNDIPSFREFVSGGNGFIADFSNSGKAAETILQTMELDRKERKELSRKARSFARGFGWEEKAKQHIRVYEGAAA